MCTSAMGKIQTRRTISLKGLTYQRLQKYCKARGYSMSGYLEMVVSEKLDAAGVPEETELRTSGRPVPERPEDIISQHFTF